MKQEATENLSDEEKNKKVLQAQKDFEQNQDKYAQEYDEGAFLKIVKALPEKITRPFVTLYYTMNHPSIEFKDKCICIAALGYIVLPFDFIPDAIPIIGWLDDIGVVQFALTQLRTWSNDPWVKEQVEAFYHEQKA